MVFFIILAQPINRHGMSFCFPEFFTLYSEFWSFHHKWPSIPWLSLFIYILFSLSLLWTGVYLYSISLYVLVCRKAIDFCRSVLYPDSLLNLLIIFSSFWVEVLESLVYFLETRIVLFLILLFLPHWFL